MKILLILTSILLSLSCIVGARSFEGTLTPRHPFERRPAAIKTTTSAYGTATSFGGFGSFGDGDGDTSYDTGDTDD